MTLAVPGPAFNQQTRQQAVPKGGQQRPNINPEQFVRRKCYPFDHQHDTNARHRYSEDVTALRTTKHYPRKTVERNGGGDQRTQTDNGEKSNVKGVCFLALAAAVNRNQRPVNRLSNEE